jgi:glycerol transport system permease protein
VLHSDRIWAALGANLVFSGIILSIEIPLGIAIALNMPKKGIWVPFCLVLMALPLLIPWNVVGTIWQIFGRADIGLLGLHAGSKWALTTTTTQRPPSTPGSRSS